MQVLTCVALYAASLSAQPGISQNGVVNEASQIPPTLPGGAIARGALFTIYGVRLASSSGRSAVTITQRGSETPAAILKATATRIDAKMPATATLGQSSLTVSSEGKSSEPFSIEVVASNPGIFSRNGQGWGPGRVENIGPGRTRSANSVTNPARPGQRIAMVVTGLGDARSATVMIGNRVARAALGRHGDEEEITVTLPYDSPLGCFVPAYLASRVASNVVTLSIGAGTCDPGPIPLLSAEKIGVALVARSRMKDRRANADTIDDEATVTFAAKNDQPVLSPLLLLPPVGTCTAYNSSFQVNMILPSSISSALMAKLEGRGLDAGGSLTLSRADQSRILRQAAGAPGIYRAHLGSAGLGSKRRALGAFLDPGEHRLAVPGGKEVGSFSIPITAPAPFEWTNRDRLAVVERSRPLTIQWQASGERVMIILATNVDQITTAIGTCLCTARASSGQFSIPAALLSKIPASMNIPGVPYDQLFVASVPARGEPAIRASGLNGGAVVSLYSIGRIVEYR